VPNFLNGRIISYSDVIYYGYTIEILCDDGFAFYDIGPISNFTCEESGNFSFQSVVGMACRKYS